MKLTFEHGLDSFRWDNDAQPAPNKMYRDVGVKFWLDAKLLEAIIKDDPDNQQAAALLAKIDDLKNEGYTHAKIRDLFRRLPQLLPDGITL